MDGVDMVGILRYRSVGTWRSMGTGRFVDIGFA
jgi:hypothetical protein